MQAAAEDLKSSTQQAGSSRGGAQAQGRHSYCRALEHPAFRHRHGRTEAQPEDEAPGKWNGPDIPEPGR